MWWTSLLWNSPLLWNRLKNYCLQVTDMEYMLFEYLITVRAGCGQIGQCHVNETYVYIYFVTIEDLSYAKYYSASML